jgi:hypothetical protein
MLADRAQLERYLSPSGGSIAGARSAGLDGALLDDLLAAASDRMIEAVPDRTLELVPADETADPVAMRFPIRGGRSIVQVPDLRELVAANIDGRELDVTTIRLRQRPRELCALWVIAPLHSPFYEELELVGRWGPAGAKIGDDPLKVRPAIADACVAWAARAFYNRAARFADNVTDPGGGQTLGYFRNLPPDVKSVLEGLEVPGL